MLCHDPADCVVSGWCRVRPYHLELVVGVGVMIIIGGGGIFAAFIILLFCAMMSHIPRNVMNLIWLALLGWIGYLIWYCSVHPDDAGYSLLTAASILFTMFFAFIYEK